MANWFQKMRRANSTALHPPWQTGQYVNYFLEYDEGGWVACALRLLGKTQDGAWIMT